MKNLILFTFLFFLIGCGKDGEMGPQGEKGEQGAKGEQGIPGKDGSTILNGTTNPNTSIGKVGDFYLNLKTGDLFGPKTSAGWGDPYNMKGQKGDIGSDGATILNGKTAPTKDQGKPGDFYINTSDYTIFGPKKESGDWGNPVSLKSNEENGVTYFYIYPNFNEVISQVNNSFDVSTKWYTIPNVNDKYMHLSYLIGFRMDNIPENISINWKDLYVENVLPSYISLDLETGLQDSKMTVLGGEIASDGSSRIKYRLKGSVVGNGIDPSFTIPLVIPNFTIKIQVYQMKNGGVIAKKTSDIERFLRINKSDK